MARRLEVELTSQRDDGTWTWRAAGAKQPKGALAGDLLPSGAKVGDVLRVEADFDIDGISVTAVLPPQRKERTEPERLEIIGSGRREGGVTTSLVPKSERRRGDRDRRPREGGDRDRRPRGDRDGRGERGGGSRPPRERRERPARPERPPVEPRPKARRLKAGRKHRNLALAALPEEQRQLGDHVLRGGIPGVRQTIDRLNEGAKAEGRQPVDPEPLVTLAEKLLPALRAAEWRDRAEAALRHVDTVDLGDLRSVINAADTWARDDESRALAAELRDALPRRVEKEHRDWLDEVATTLAEGRVMRALRLSSRPPKAGSPVPSELSARLAAAASEGLTDQTGQDRYAALLEAAALSPVHAQVEPLGVPAQPNDALLAVVRKTARQLPQIAARFGVQPGDAPRPPRGGARRGGRPPAPPAAPTNAGTPASATGAAPASPESAAPAESAAAAEPAVAPESEQG